MKRAILPFAIVCLVASTALALTVTSGTLTQSRAGNRGEIERLDLGWSTEIHSGKVRASGVAVDGRVLRVVVDSDTGTSVQVPTAGYDIRLRDLDGFDVLSGAAVGVTTSTLIMQSINASDTAITTGTFVRFLGPLTFEIDDAGTTPTRTGLVRLYYTRDR